MIEMLAVFMRQSQQFFRAVDGGALLIAGDEKPIEPFIGPVLPTKASAAAVKAAMAPFISARRGPRSRPRRAPRRKRIEAPGRRVSRRHDIGMAGEDEMGPRRADARIEIVDVWRAAFRK